VAAALIPWLLIGNEDGHENGDALITKKTAPD